MPAFRKPTSATFLACCLALTLWRSLYGLSQNFWHEDVVQIYLLGLKYFTTSLWPFFGPDIVHTNQQIPGALQALLIGIPLKVIPQPEAPFVLVNLLSIAGIILLAWYLSRRFAGYRFLLLVFWLATLPSTLQFSTNTYNPSYLLFPSCVFFVAWYESQSRFRTLNLNATLIGAMIGFAVMFTFQLHMSWPLFFPFVVTGLFLPDPSLGRRPLILGFIAGAATSSLCLIPTILTFGLESLWTAGASNTAVHFEQLREAPTILTRYLSLGSYEFFGFNLSASLSDRRAFIMAQPLLFLCAAVMLAGLFWQVYLTLAMMVSYARSRTARYSEYTLFIVVFCWIVTLFLLTPRPPAVRNFYLLFPVVVLAVLRMFQNVGRDILVGRILITLVASSLLFHTLVGAALFPQISLYKDRRRISGAIESGDYRILGERRPGQY